MKFQCSVPRFLFNSSLSSLAALTASLSASSNTLAAEYLSVEAPVTIAYDVQSTSGKKLYLLRQGTPLEVIVSLPNWSKVRDAEGGLAWVERKALGNKRNVIVTQAKAEVRQSADANSPLLFEVHKNVVLEWQSVPSKGWIKVRHADGPAGFIKSVHVWGY